MDVKTFGGFYEDNLVEQCRRYTFGDVLKEELPQQGDQASLLGADGERRLRRASARRAATALCFATFASPGRICKEEVLYQRFVALRETR